MNFTTANGMAPPPNDICLVVIIVLFFLALLACLAVQFSRFSFAAMRSRSAFSRMKPSASAWL